MQFSITLSTSIKGVRMTINTFQAVGIAEGFIEADSEEQVIEAWQYLVDSGIVWQLQGWFGRTATDLIERGFITAPAHSN